MKSMIWALSGLLVACHSQTSGGSLSQESAEFNPAFSPAACSYDAPPPVPARGPTIPAAVRVGIGEAPLDLPVGTPLGGYSDRIKLLGGRGPDSRQSYWAKAFAPSAGVQSTPHARALFLQVGDEPLLLIKLDQCVVTDRLVYDLEQALSVNGDGSLNGHIIVTASHSHSAYGDFDMTFHLTLGFDMFQEVQYQRLLASLVQAGKAALGATQPAKMGVGIWEGWDPSDQVFSDRRDEQAVLPGPNGLPQGAVKDDRLTVIRIDAMDDQPLALLFHFPMHGTVADADNPLASVDSTGHVELALEEYFDSQVLVMHLQGPAGDQSPRGIDTGLALPCDNTKRSCSDFPRMESIGEIAAPRIYSVWQRVPTTALLEMEVQTRAVPNGRSITARAGAMSYAPYDANADIDFSHAGIYDDAGVTNVHAPIKQFNVSVGAGLCGSTAKPLPVAGISGATLAPYASCVDIGAATQFIASAVQVTPPSVPDCPTTRTTLSAVRLSGMPVARRQPVTDASAPVSYRTDTEDLLFATLPGEPVTNLAQIVRAASPFGPDRTFVLGYAQGHIGYLLQVENWLLGGYEPSINIYGPIEAEWLADHAHALLQVAATKAREDGAGAAIPGRSDRLHFVPAALQNPPAEVAQSGLLTGAPPVDLYTRVNQPLASSQPAAVVPRVSGRALFVWSGGTPEDGTPVVVLEQLSAAGFAAVVKRSGRALSNRGKEMIVTYTPQPVSAPPGMVQQHLWSAEWQAVGWEQDSQRIGTAAATAAPLGTYRLTVSGTANGKPYTLSSTPFAVVAESALQVTLSRQGSTLSGTAVYPVGAGFRLLRLSGPSDGNVPVASTLQLTVTGKADGKQVQTQATPLSDGSFSVAISGTNLSQGAVVSVADADGNSGAASVN